MASSTAISVGLDLVSRRGAEASELDVELVAHRAERGPVGAPDAALGRGDRRRMDEPVVSPRSRYREQYPAREPGGGSYSGPPGSSRSAAPSAPASASRMTARRARASRRRSARTRACSAAAAPRARRAALIEEHAAALRRRAQGVRVAHRHVAALGRNLSKPNSSLIASAASASVSAHFTVSADEIATDDVHGAGAPRRTTGCRRPSWCSRTRRTRPSTRPRAPSRRRRASSPRVLLHRCSRNLASSSSSSSASSSSSDWNADAACARSVSSIRRALGADLASTHSSLKLLSHPLKARSTCEPRTARRRPPPASDASSRATSVVDYAGMPPACAAAPVTSGARRCASGPRRAEEAALAGMTTRSNSCAAYLRRRPPRESARTGRCAAVPTVRSPPRASRAERVAVAAGWTPFNKLLLRNPSRRAQWGEGRPRFMAARPRRRAAAPARQRAQRRRCR